MKNKLKSALSFFTTLSNTVKQANKDIDAAKLKLTTEIAAIGVIKTETETTRFYVDYDDLMLSLLKEAAQKMINTSGCAGNGSTSYHTRVGDRHDTGADNKKVLA